LGSAVLALGFSAGQRFKHGFDAARTLEASV
jgi:hypothetical protein